MKAITIVDGAALYEQPNFDSTILDYLGENKKLSVSRKPVRGGGGLGLFHRVKHSGGSVYITDTDIRIEKGAASSESSAEKSADDSAPRKKKKKRTRVDEDTGEVMTPYFTRYLGGAVGMVNFTERFSGRNLSAQVPMYGLRMTGPGTLFDGPPLDMNILFSVSTPEYYNQFASQTPKGFLMFGDLVANFPFYEWGDDGYVYYGLGMMWTYTNYKVKIGNNIFDSQEFRIGADMGLGYGHRINQWIVRADAKYYFERTRYFGYFLTLQMEY